MTTIQCRIFAAYSFMINNIPGTLYFVRNEDSKYSFLICEVNGTKHEIRRHNRGNLNMYKNVEKVFEGGKEKFSFVKISFKSVPFSDPFFSFDLDETGKTQEVYYKHGGRISQSYRHDFYLKSLFSQPGDLLGTESGENCFLSSKEEALLFNRQNKPIPPTPTCLSHAVQNAMRDFLHIDFNPDTDTFEMALEKAILAAEASKEKLNKLEQNT